jgi:hypothetical protein
MVVDGFGPRPVDHATPKRSMPGVRTSRPARPPAARRRRGRDARCPLRSSALVTMTRPAGGVMRAKARICCDGTPVGAWCSAAVLHRVRTTEWILRRKPRVMSNVGARRGPVGWSRVRHSGPVPRGRARWSGRYPSESPAGGRRSHVHRGERTGSSFAASEASRRSREAPGLADRRPPELRHALTSSGIRSGPGGGSLALYCAIRPTSGMRAPRLMCRRTGASTVPPTLS